MLVPIFLTLYTWKKFSDTQNLETDVGKSSRIFSFTLGKVRESCILRDHALLQKEIRENTERESEKKTCGFSGQKWIKGLSMNVKKRGR